ncbi:MAG: transcription-repair coupling factor [Actinobacteria bacterium]|nr:MAG: transcription-repair coupling factor [Actinomycetota bacterium]
MVRVGGPARIALTGSGIPSERFMNAPLQPLLDGWRSVPLPALDGTWSVAHAGQAFAIAGLVSQIERTVLVVVPGERDAGDLADDLALFLDDVTFAPAWETLPFEHVSPNISTMAGRAQARDRLSRPAAPGVVVASVRGAIQRLSPSSFAPIRLETGQTADLGELIGELAALGYQRTDRVEARGEFAVRGGILDVFPAQADEPVRVDFWGDEIEEIRGFSVASQRSDEIKKAFVAYPAREVRPGDEVNARARDLLASEPWAGSTWDRIVEGHLFPGIESWLPWISGEVSLIDEAPESAVIVVVDPSRARDRSRDLREEERDLAAALAPTWGESAPVAGEHPMLFLDLEDSLGARAHLSMPSTPTGPSDPVLDLKGFDAIAGDPVSVSGALSRLLERGITPVIAMDGEPAADRVARLLMENGLALDRLDALENPRPAVIPTGIHRGFVCTQPAVAVLGEQEIAGRRRAHRRTGRSRAAGQPQYRDLVEGDYVVHHQHGIGRFEGLVTRTMMGIERDYLVIAYAGDDRLYVPVDQLAAVKKYTGGEAPRVSRMGGKDWSDQKSRVRRAVAAVAQEVVELHRQRARATGHAFDPDTPWQSEMEASFPFEETVDQDSAIGEVKRDMERDRPMDRLVFGDVGFGKTEVAIRAAFKAIQSGRQVAVLCPTTLLAQQHHQTFAERFAPYPIRVEQLSRFLTPKQQREVVSGLETGEVDLVVGTHRLLSEDVSFKALGLLVIDEEQRFGVAAKDAMKRLKVGVDVLTLTATPIPRTLEMALTGIREVSHIRTPPEDRHPILTYVGPYDDQAVSAAIRREILREGQVFYVHNRVQSIDRAVARLKELVPDARYVVAHGQMSEGQLEQVMIDFWNGDYDVMVATTIIESGLDLPKVNTLIVERADLLGLAQLYQLRGRVGRSDQRAYAYLFHPPDQSLTEEAHRRLEAIGEATDLGSGFQLAIRDLEIRGAGSILGEVQTGHISAVGFDLYAELVAEAVDELEGRETVEDRAPEVRIDLPVDAHLPDEYIQDQELRLEAYRRLAGTTTHQEVDDVVAEWVDRYGDLPAEAVTLAQIARLRVEAIRVGLEEIVRLRDEVRMGPVDLKPSQEIRLQRLQPRSVLRASEGVLFIPAPEPILEGLLGFVREMWDA